MLEPSKQNVLQRSEEFDNSYWVNNGVTILANQTISPSGSLTADLLTGVSGGFGVVRFSTWSATNKVASCFAKKGSTELFKIANGSGGVGGVTFNLENGIVITEDSGFEGSIENYGNGWFRCIAIDTLGRSGTFSLGVTAASESVYIWGAQLEQGSYLTSYIPTNGSAVTRSSETANNSGDGSTFNDSEGVLMAEISALVDNSSVREIALSDGSSSNRIELRYGAASNRIQFVARSGGVVQASISNESNNIILNNKVVIKYKLNDFSLWVNGFELGKDNSGSTPIGLSELAFDDGGGNLDFYGNTKQIQYFDSALTDSELEKLTSWTSFTDMANGQLYTIE